MLRVMKSADSTPRLLSLRNNFCGAQTVMYGKVGFADRTAVHPAAQRVQCLTNTRILQRRIAHGQTATHCRLRTLFCNLHVLFVVFPHTGPGMDGLMDM